jgi:acetyl-CoA C-acetyltransferase
MESPLCFVNHIIAPEGRSKCGARQHPAFHGGMTKIIESIRQLRGEAHPAVEVPGLALGLVQATGWLLGARHGSATLILERQ